MVVISAAQYRPTCDSGRCNVDTCTDPSCSTSNGGPGWCTPPVIVVLPFENLSGEAKDDYLVAGITEDVTTDLSRVPGMFVIARESAYTYRGQAGRCA